MLNILMTKKRAIVELESVCVDLGKKHAKVTD